MTETEKAYIAGFFDGEGCVHFKDGKHRRPRLTVVQKDPRTLRWIHERMQCGTLRQRSQRGDGWELKFDSQADVLIFTAAVLPYAQLKKPALEAARQNFRDNPIRR